MEDIVNKIKVYANNTPYTCKLEDDVMPQIIPQEYSESGIGKKILVNKYERNSTARRRCLEIHGTKCIICGFDAGEVYGDDYKDKIEVHHIIPIHKLKNDYKIDPCEDLVPVCPNCHMILHTKARNNEYPTIESLKSALGRKH